MGVEEVLQNPTLVFARVVYASVILIKLSISASMPSSELGNLVAPESNKIETYLDQLLVHLKNVSILDNSNRHVLSSKFLGILTKLKIWFQHQKQQTSTEAFTNSKPNQGNDSNEAFATNPSLQTTPSAQLLQFEPPMGSIPWSGPAPQNPQPAPQYDMPSLEKVGFFNDFSRPQSAPVVDQVGTQPTQPTSWPTDFQTSNFYPFNFPTEVDPNLFTHLVNMELDQTNQSNWLPDVDSFNAMDYANLPEFNWATWPQQ